MIEPTSQPDTSATNREAPFDALRGLIMMLMALDHANIFIAHAHPQAEFWRGSFPTYTDPLAFLTRFVSHLAAPGFFFLLGVGLTRFSATRRHQGWPIAAIMGYLGLRGLLLIALQFGIENPAWNLATDGGPPLLYIGVLYGLGAALLLGIFLGHLPTPLLLGISLTLPLLIEWLLPVSPTAPRLPSLLTGLLLAPGWTTQVIVYYPVLPWLAPLALGIVFGRWLHPNPSPAYQHAAWMGLLALLLFIPLRLANGLGNIRPLADEGLIALLNVVKYPPSLTFLLLTLGVNLLLLALFARLPPGLLTPTNPLLVFGRSPLFFYLTHLYLYAGMGLLIGPEGTGIPRMYPLWLLGLLLLYPLCRWYGRFKQCQPLTSLWRLL